jgi:hypothetical protein
MTVYTRTINRITVSEVQQPLWRRNMVVPDRWYSVGTEQPSDGNIRCIYPNGVVPSHFSAVYSTQGGQFGEPAQESMNGYASVVHADYLGGPWGTMLFGTGGHARFQNMILKYTLSDDSPRYDWYQQPYYQTNAANGAEVYWSPSEFNALRPAAKYTRDTETLAASQWDRQWPFGYDGWIFHGPAKTINLGNNNAHGWRYTLVSHLPAEMTGTPAGGYFVTWGLQGPFENSRQPINVSFEDWFDPAYLWPGSTFPKNYPSFRDSATGQWSLLSQAIPDFEPNNQYPTRQTVAPIAKKVYVRLSKNAFGAFVWCEIDFSNGIAGASVSGEMSDANFVAFPEGEGQILEQDGHVYWYWISWGTPYNSLVMRDMTTGTVYRIGPFPGWSRSFPEDASRLSIDTVQRKLFVTAGINQVPIAARDWPNWYESIAIPADPTNAGAYVHTHKTLDFDAGVDQGGSGAANAYYNGVLPRLGVFIVFRHIGTPLAFIPS